MTSPKPLCHWILPALLIGGLAGCSTPDSAPVMPSNLVGREFAPPTELNGALAGGNIDLKWKNNALVPGGTWVEFTTPGSDFVKLDARWPDQTTFHHPDVAPDSKYIYRIQPFFGYPSAIASATTGKAPAEGTPNRDEEGPLEEKPAADRAPHKSLRSLSTIREAVPVDVTATLFSPTTIDVRWKDRAADEEGFVVEASADPAQGFQIVALLPADITSFRKTHLPPETKCYFRVRAFFYGKPSAEVTVNTGPAQALKPAVN